MASAAKPIDDIIVRVLFAQVPDPVGSGYVASLARPGGNTTGFTQFDFSMTGKWLGLLKTIEPSLTRVSFGSLADMALLVEDVCFTPESDMDHVTRDVC